MAKKRVAIIAGTRPEVIKMAPVYFALRESETLQPVWLSTGQHREMLDQALQVFGITPDHDLRLMKAAQGLGDLTARVVSAVSGYLTENQTDTVLVQGDTTTVLGSALAAFYADIPIGHIEAGLRTGDMRSPFPEEMNRRLTDPLCQWCFAPTQRSADNLLAEKIPADRVHVTGNTVIDSLLWVRDQVSAKQVNVDDIAQRCAIPDSFVDGFLRDEGRRWILVTGHRRESFGGGFEQLCGAIRDLVERHPDVGVLYPVHLNPSVREPVNRLLSDLDRVALVEPAGYEDFIWLMDRCFFVLSDSGGVQEEAPSLGKPVLVMRETTERPEGVDAGTCRLVGTDPAKILSEAELLLSDPAEMEHRSAIKNPYGDGKSALRTREVLETEL